MAVASPWWGGPPPAPAADHVQGRVGVTVAAGAGTSRLGVFGRFGSVPLPGLWAGVLLFDRNRDSGDERVPARQLQTHPLRGKGSRGGTSGRKVCPRHWASGSCGRRRECRWGPGPAGAQYQVSGFHLT